MDKLILSDIDDVVLAWTSSFLDWCESMSITVKSRKGHRIEEMIEVGNEDCSYLIHDFHKTDSFKKLPAFADSAIYVSKLLDNGFNFVFITSSNTAEGVTEIRKQNIADVFGIPDPEVFCLPLKSSKRAILEMYESSDLLWVEDNHINALTGVQLGLDSVLISDLGCISESVTQLSTSDPWKQIYHLANKKYKKGKCSV